MARFRGTNGDDQFFGGLDRDVLYGQGGNDWLTGGANDDYLNGGAGNDELNGDDGFDRLRGGAGDDVLVDTLGGGDISCGAGNDWAFIDGATVRGDRGNDNLGGPSGRMEGGPGDDLLGGWCQNSDGTGTPGWLQLVGGRGADTFFAGATTGDWMVDWIDIYDFRPEEGDRIDFRTIEADGLSTAPSLETAARHDSNLNGMLDDGDNAVVFSEGLLWIDMGDGPTGGDGSPFTSDGDYLVVHGHEALDLAFFAS
jgi:Ca2+-binding RTX toxin-like protein